MARLLEIVIGTRLRQSKIQYRKCNSYKISLLIFSIFSIRTNQARAIKEASQQHSRATKKWWDTVNSISGRNSTSAPITSILDPDDINHYFSINKH